MIQKRLPITVVVLTYNEALNLDKCLSSVDSYADEIIIVDSGSKDNTLNVASKFNSKIFSHKFETHNKQWIWALNNTDIKNEWVMGLDADQTSTKELWEEISLIFNDGTENIDGIYINRKYIFRGQWIKYGGMFPKYLLKLFKKNKVLLDENELVDHHFYINGNTINTENYIVEENYKENNLSFWMSKHRIYAELFAEELVNSKNQKIISPDSRGNPDQRALYFKSYYLKSPLFIRPVLYFFYRYFVKLGIFDGKQGLIFHTLHSLWFRFLIDTKIYKLKKQKKC